MTVVPTFTSPCDLAQRIPNMIASFFQLDTGLGRKFREESATDVIVASLLQMAEKDVVVVLPNESVTGSDFDITIVDSSTLDSVQFRIQAKKLTAHKIDWEKGVYKELAHPHGTGAQASTLIRSSAHEKIPTIPLYAFYNPTKTCEDSGGIISGVELASGVAIAELVKQTVQARPQRTKNKRLSALRHLFFPFSTILCSTTEGRRIPSPEDARSAVEIMMSNRETGLDEFFSIDLGRKKSVEYFRPSAPHAEGDEIDGFVDSSTKGAPLTQVVRRALEARHDTPLIKGNVKRTKVILFSEDR